MASALTPAGAQTTSPTTSPATTQPALPEGLTWFDATKLPVWGKAFAHTEAPFDRLPGQAKSQVRPAVWELQRDTAGFALHLKTDARALYVRYDVTRTNLAMSNMAATGVSGLDVYARVARGESTAWQYAGTFQPRARPLEGKLCDLPAVGSAGATGEYIVHFPLYNGVARLELGVPAGASMSFVAPDRTPKPGGLGNPLVWYGTSILQGASASRPGLAFTNILSRRLGREIFNFGFSGNGQTERAVVEYLMEIDAAALVLDCVANTAADVLTARTIEVVRFYRQERASTPILLLGQRLWSQAPLRPELLRSHGAKSAALRKAYDELVASGVKGLHYREGDDLLGDDTEATVDGSHPNDLGMMRFADALEPELRKLLA